MHCDICTSLCNLTPPLVTPVRVERTADGFSCEAWDLNTAIFRLPTGDVWNLGDACQGVLILGATGSGKSSGSADLLALKLLRLGAGGIVLCVKVDEGDYWERLAGLTGRTHDLSNNAKLNRSAGALGAPDTETRRLTTIARSSNPGIRGYR